jgi:hypothetical protein
MFSPYVSVVLRSFTTSSPIVRNVSLVIMRLLVLALLLIEYASMIRAQGYNATPLGAAPGAPAGSYELSDLENINLFNGNLNFRLPLLEIGGRGGQ